LLLERLGVDAIPVHGRGASVVIEFRHAAAIPVPFARWRLGRVF
jgi:hypothetical protein